MELIKYVKESKYNEKSSESDYNKEKVIFYTYI